MNLGVGWRGVWLAAGSVLALGGCTTLGSGHATVVLAVLPAAKAYNGTEFGYLIVKPGQSRIVVTHGDPAEGAAHWAAYQDKHAGTQDSARMDVTTRDLNVTPPLDPLNIEATNAGDIAKIMSDNTTTLAQKTALVRGLRDNYRQMPENFLPFVSRQEDVEFDPVTHLGLGKIVAKAGSATSEAVTVYHYYPKVAIDLTGELQTVASLDRFEFLAVAVRLVDPTKQVTFANFSPKPADLFDFTLGSLKQTASASATATPGSSSTAKDTATSTPATGSTQGSERDSGTTYGANLNLSLSNELTHDLKSSLEGRAAGIVGDQRVFMMQLRGNDQRRIAGTYSYSVMLDIPSIPRRIKAKDSTQTYIVSNPVVDALTAEVRIVGVVRHVGKMGMTGTFTRVPEPTNDDTYEEVLVSEKTVPLWQLHQNVMVDTEANTTPPPNLVVYTNQDAATFTVYADGPGRTVLARGKGREASLLLKKARQVSIVFDPIVTSGATPHALTAPPVEHLLIDATGETKAQVVSNYLPPPPKPEGHHGH
jgi:hypothetical protein